MRIFLLVAVLVGALLPVQAEAAFYTGNDLVERMRENEKKTADRELFSAYQGGTYIGFVAAVHDGFVASEVICPPKNVTLGQTVAVVTAYLKAHPTDWHKSAISLVGEALKEAFPCE